MFLNDSLQSMANFYLTQDDPVSDEEAEILAEDEYKKLQEVKRFYKGCCFDFDEQDSTNIEMISVSTP